MPNPLTKVPGLEFRGKQEVETFRQHDPEKQNV